MTKNSRRHTWAARTAGALALALAFGGRVSVQQPPASDPARAAFMQAHFSEAIVLHDAVARGDLAAARTQAVRLADHRPDVPFPTGAHVFFGLMTIDAGRVRDAKTIATAGQAAASLLSRCGQCHAAMHVRMALAAAPDPVVGGLVGQMLAHQRAIGLLLEGLIAPSPATWAAGAREFATLRVSPDAMPSRQLAQRARIANARAASLARDAARADRPPDRAEAYGRILATCARCHQEHPGVWGPRR